MSVTSIKEKFDSLLSGLNSSPAISFSKSVEAAYEALVLADLIREYESKKSGIREIIPPPSKEFLNQAPGKFRTERSFFVDFNDGDAYYFAADIEVHGLVARSGSLPKGTLFEADVAVIKKDAVAEVTGPFRGYPGPQHLDCLMECKHGEFYKSHLRELLGLRRHVSVLNPSGSGRPEWLYGLRVQNAVPPIPIFMARPTSPAFFDADSAELYDLKQVRIGTKP